MLFPAGEIIRRIADESMRNSLRAGHGHRRPSTRPRARCGDPRSGRTGARRERLAEIDDFFFARSNDRELFLRTCVRLGCLACGISEKSLISDGVPLPGPRMWPAGGGDREGERVGTSRPAPPARSRANFAHTSAKARGSYLESSGDRDRLSRPRQNRPSPHQILSTAWPVAAADARAGPTVSGGAGSSQ